MIMRTSAILAIVLLYSFAGQAYAQELDKSGECGAQIDLTTFNTGERIDYFNIVSEPTLYVAANDDRRIDETASRLVQMQTHGNIIEETADRALFRSRKKLLNDDFICGWIDKNDLLPFDADPIRVETPIQWENPQTGVVEELNNPLPLKAMLRSNPALETDDAKLVQIYDRPTITSNPRTEASVFGIYLIYAERLMPDNSFWFWIAGEEPHVPTKFAGWVPETHILQWETQLSLYFNEVQDATDIFADPDSARRDNTESVLARKPTEFDERSTGPVDTTRTNSSNNIARFPILLEEATAAGRGQTIYRIGFFGDSTLVEEESSRAAIQQNVKKIDMLFVLDNTLSMTEYFPFVVSAVRKSTDRIAIINQENDYDVEVKYAAAVYGDYRDQTANLEDMDFQILARLGSPGYTDHLARLTAIAEEGDYYRDALQDTPEAGLAGIVRGVSELQWSEGTEFKVIVWIGDHGGRETGVSENVSVAQVQSLMQDEKVLVLPINVSGRYNEIWNGEFIRQGNELASIRGLETKIAHSGEQSNDYESTETYIEESIANMYTSSLAASFAIREGTNISQVLSERTDLLDLDIPAAEADVRKISTAICEMAFGPAGCVNVEKNRQFMAEGFVKYDERFKNYSFWVNLETLELDVLSRMMRLTCRGFERSSVKRSIEQAMLLVTSTLAGESYRSDIPVGRFLRRYSFLPAKHFPSILESTPDRIEELWQEARNIDTQNGNNVETRRIADPICRSSALLNLALDGKRLIDDSTDLVRASELTDGSEDSFQWVVADNSRLVDFNWEWSQGGGNNYYYLPVDFFPGSLTLE